MKDLERAKALLKERGYTCVFCKDYTEKGFFERGIKPLVSLYKSGQSVSGFSAADKVVGKGAGFMYLWLNVKKLYAEIISHSALELLIENGVKVSYGKLVENIINREGTGICPFEKAVLSTTDKKEALKIILDKMREMNIGD